MFSKSLLLGTIAAAMFAIVAIIPVSAQLSNPDVDDILDNPDEYCNQEVTIQGELDRVFSDQAFAIEDDQDIFGEDRILVIRVGPNAAISNLDGDDYDDDDLVDVDIDDDDQSCPSEATTCPSAADKAETCPSADTATTCPSAADTAETCPSKEAPVIANVCELEEGDLIQASGVVRMFDPVALEHEFGPLNLGDLQDRRPSLYDTRKPVLIVGERQRAATPAVVEEQVVEFIPPPVIEEPPAEPEPPVEEVIIIEEPVELPKTSTGLPLFALIGSFATALGFALRRR